jgi:hypothetical protein
MLREPDQSAPFTILEGNHRLTADVRSGQSGLNIPVLVGLSKLSCVLHILDTAITRCYGT